MKACLGYRSVRSVSWAVEKMLKQIGMRCNKIRTIVVTSKSFFLPEEPESRISRSYCRNVKPSNIYVYVYIGPEVQSEDMK